jgi:hypothetical protein
VTVHLRWLALAVCLAVPAQSQEVVDLDLPGPIEVKTLETGREAEAPLARLGFRHALLRPGRKLRISVRAEKLDAQIRSVSFSTGNAEGGAGLRGRLSGHDWVPIFEGRPLAVSGGAEIIWRIETASRVTRAGAHDIVLRWRVESIPSEIEAGLAFPANGSSGPPGSEPAPFLEESPRGEARRGRQPIPP